ncbi:hypothetical protein [Nostoc sp.]|uniref:hypothetical protein n=1 Tax=Nostoc sp. TaxID=1180 RepID=UPI002FF78091
MIFIPSTLAILSVLGNETALRYRLRGDAESYGQTLNRLSPNGGFTVLFKEPQISLRQTYEN